MKNFVLLHPNRFVWNLISYSDIDQKKEEKLEEAIERPANQVKEDLVWKLISYIFQLYESYEIKFPAKISSFTVDAAGAHSLVLPNIILVNHDLYS